MSTNRTQRSTPERLIESHARSVWRRLDRAERQIARATEDAADARRELTLIHEKACERFGRQIPADALLLDVLDLVDVEEGDVWRWRGRRNNKDTPTVIVSEGRARGEKSLVRYLAIELGVIAEDAYGTLYPNGDQDDVNPWHRTLRRSDAPMGNPKRWLFDEGRTTGGAE